MEEAFERIYCASARSWCTGDGNGHTLSKGSVFDEGMVRMTWDGDSNKGKN